MAQEIRCIKCGSEKVSTYDKVLQSAWTLGLPRVAEYKRGKQESYKECECLKCGKKFKFFPQWKQAEELPALDQKRAHLIGKKVRLRNPEGKTVEAIVRSPIGDVVVNSGTESEFFAYAQAFIEIPIRDWGKADVVPTLILDDSDAPVGVLWASGSDKEDNILGIVQPISGANPRRKSE